MTGQAAEARSAGATAGLARSSQAGHTAAANYQKCTTCLVSAGQVEQRKAQRGKLHRQRVVGAQLQARQVVQR